MSWLDAADPLQVGQACQAHALARFGSHGLTQLGCPLLGQTRVGVGLSSERSITPGATAHGAEAAPRSDGCATDLARPIGLPPVDPACIQIAKFVVQARVLALIAQLRQVFRSVIHLVLIDVVDDFSWQDGVVGVRFSPDEPRTQSVRFAQPKSRLEIRVNHDVHTATRDELARLKHDAQGAPPPIVAFRSGASMTGAAISTGRAAIDRRLRRDMDPRKARAAGWTQRRCFHSLIILRETWGYHLVMVS